MLTNHTPPPATSQDGEVAIRDSRNEKFGDDFKKKRPYFHFIAFMMILIHAVAPVAIYVVVSRVTIINLLWLYLYTCFGAYGITGGAHRLWSHKSFKAKLPLRMFLLIGYYSAGQHPVYHWVHNHRLHHKYSDTDADPHNSKRGFYFSHAGWLLQEEHPEVTRQRPEIDISDIMNDPLLRFFDRYFLPFVAFFCYILPTLIPVYLWQESWLYSFSLAVIHHVILLHLSFSVNSFAHMWGQRPYDKRIQSRNNAYVSFLSYGEGWHNYHHSFPWDYRASEFGGGYLNTTAALLNFFTKIGWAYDLKKPSDKLVKTYIQKYGDGTHVSEVPEEQTENSNN